jgi:two-component system, OmpR family, sensor histidine kinase KdpD
LPNVESLASPREALVFSLVFVQPSRNVAVQSTKLPEGAMIDQRDPEKRPSPNALLKTVGKLKVFVGAAPGVGKTYKMLVDAQAKRREGVDLIVGIVETHGSKETQTLLNGLEVVPCKRIEYRGQTFDGMDLDAIIARRPQLALVDELAHTNLPGSRHQKRYLDIEELLDCGIDVYTTVNIHHIESLNDVVAQITHVRVRETVPDAVFDRAEAIELVDLTPNDLIQRFKEGKVYVPKQAERALERFFSPANLTALRELALRRTAERVDDQLLTEMQAHAIPGPWAAGERILVCINEDPRCAGLLRYAKRLADRLHGPWVALYIEGRRSLQLSEEERDRIADTLRLAQSLGGEALTFPGSDKLTSDDVLGFARANNVTQIVLGKSSRSRWYELLYGSTVHELVRAAGNISVHVIAGDDIEGEPIPKKTVKTGKKREPFEWRPYVMAVLALVAAVGAAELTSSFLGIESVNLIFLTAIVGVAARFGLWPSLFASIASSLCYNFFFMPPIYTFTVADPNNLANLLFFTILAIVVSNLAAQARRQADAAMSRARTAEALYAFSRKLAGEGTLDDVLWATAYQIASMINVNVVILLPEKHSIVVKAGYPPEETLDESELEAAKWAWEHNRSAGRGSDTLPEVRRLFLPMRTGRGAVGVIGINNNKQGPVLTPDEQRLLDALLDQSALAIERLRLVSRPWPMRSLS